MLTAAKYSQWQEAIDYYLLDRADYTEATQRVYRLNLTRFFNEICLDVDKIGRLHILKYLQKYGCANTYNTQIYILSSFFSFVSDNYHLPNPTKNIRKRKVLEVKRRVLTKAEYDLIYAAPKTQGRNLAVFLANTGLRISELKTLKRYDTYITVIGKGQKPRTVPLNKTAKEVLNNLPMQLPKSDTIRDYFCRLAKKIGIEPFNPHSLRHFFASYLIEHGANIATVSKILGHADINTTIKYYYHPDDLDGVVELLDS